MPRTWFTQRFLNAKTYYQPPVKDQRTKDCNPGGWKWYLKVLLFLTVVCIFILINLENFTITKSSTESTSQLNVLYESTIRSKILNESEKLNLKYILMWTSNKTSPLSFWKSGQQVFIENKCPVSNCFVTNRRDYFGGDVTKFDAIVFNGRNLKTSKLSDLPKKRSPYQKYIFLNMESSDNQPICSPIFDGFFNWTATYKLNSDIVYSYLLIRNASGDEVGPGVNMTWINQMSETNESLVHTLGKKTEAAAWFVSHCYTRSDREKYAEGLKEALKKYNLTLDVYGKCGNLECPRSSQNQCEEILRERYFFFLSFENSFAEDYVTEKALTALLNSVVPIVYGGADYSRFLPPGSFIAANLFTPDELASLLADIISSPAVYYDFFRWRNHYSFHQPGNVCRLCAALNNQTMLHTQTVYKNFRGWWNPDHKKRCKNKLWGA